jgi:hypothetical protein
MVSFNEKVPRNSKISIFNNRGECVSSGGSNSELPVKHHILRHLEHARGLLPGSLEKEPIDLSAIATIRKWQPNQGYDAINFEHEVEIQLV